MMALICGLILLCSLVPLAHSLTQHDQVIQLKKHLLMNYTKEVIPKSNLDEPITIAANFFLHTVINFDEITGALKFSSGVSMVWIDEYIKWDPSQYENITTVSISVNDVWVPNLILMNAADNNGIVFFDPSVTNYNVEFTYTGQALLVQGGILTSICEATIQKYPFDDHSCPLYFVVFGMSVSKVSIKTEVIYELNVTKNSKWNIEQRDPYIETLLSTPMLVCEIILKRKPLFILMNFLFPVVLIVGISLMTFVLPQESGDRISFATTMFLSMTVSMAAIADKLPPTSSPTPYLIFVLAIAVLISSLITFSALVGINMFYKDGNKERVPLFLSVVSSFVLQFPRRKQKINSNNSVEQQPESEDSHDMNEPNESHVKNEPHIVTSWKMVVKAMDRICFWFNLITFVISVVVYIVLVLRTS